MMIPKGSLPYLLTLALAFVITVPIPLDAQQTDSDTTDTEPVAAPSIPVTTEKQYRVEVIVFNYHGPISANGEIWHRVSPFEFSPESYRVTSLPEEEDSIELTNEPNNPIQFTELNALLPYLSKLHSDSRYEVATYSAWTQPLYEKNESVRVELVPPIDADSINEVSPFREPTATGSVQIFENRLLFVDIDIQNNFDSGLVDYSNPSSASDSPTGIHRIKEKRRVKLNEIHYFDHPFFGALVRVSREES